MSSHSLHPETEPRVANDRLPFGGRRGAPGVSLVSADG